MMCSPPQVPNMFVPWRPVAGAAALRPPPSPLLLLHGRQAPRPLGIPLFRFFPRSPTRSATPVPIKLSLTLVRPHTPLPLTMAAPSPRHSALPTQQPRRSSLHPRRSRPPASGTLTSTTPQASTVVCTKAVLPQRRERAAVHIDERTARLSPVNCPLRPDGGTA